MTETIIETKTFTENEIKVLDSIVKAVSERGTDYIYSAPSSMLRDNETSGTCFYVHPDDTAGCIIGFAAIDSGLMTAGMLSTYEGQAAYILPLNDTSADFRESLSNAQALQDGGLPWGEARDCLFEELSGLGYDVSRWV